MAINRNIYFNLSYIINCSLKVIREASPVLHEPDGLVSKQGKVRENFVFFPLMSSVVETSLIKYSTLHLEISPSGSERTT